ncbi:MAG: disulfide bond formation protein B [Solitalea-like symbiont of Acarus siro]
MKSFTISYCINLAGIIIFSFILLGGFYMQFVEHEFPCPLCLIQRMAMLAVVFGLLLNVLYQIKPMHYGISILSALLGMALSIRQVLLHICPKPGTPTGYGLPVMGMHLYTWALIFFFVSIVACAILCILYKDKFSHIKEIPANLLKLGKIALYMVALIALTNFFATFFECALGVCPDDPIEYMLIKGKYY